MPDEVEDNQELAVEQDGAPIEIFEGPFTNETEVDFENLRAGAEVAEETARQAEDFVIQNQDKPEFVEEVQAMVEVKTEAKEIKSGFLRGLDKIFGGVKEKLKGGLEKSVKVDDEKVIASLHAKLNKLQVALLTKKTDFLKKVAKKLGTKYYSIPKKEEEKAMTEFSYGKESGDEFLELLDLHKKAEKSDYKKWEKAEEVLLRVARDLIYSALRKGNLEAALRLYDRLPDLLGLSEISERIVMFVDDQFKEEYDKNEGYFDSEKARFENKRKARINFFKDKLKFRPDLRFSTFFINDPYYRGGGLECVDDAQLGVFKDIIIKGNRDCILAKFSPTEKMTEEEVDRLFEAYRRFDKNKILNNIDRLKSRVEKLTDAERDDVILPLIENGACLNNPGFEQYLRFFPLTKAQTREFVHKFWDYYEPSDNKTKDEDKRKCIEHLSINFPQIFLFDSNLEKMSNVFEWPLTAIDQKKVIRYCSGGLDERGNLNGDIDNLKMVIDRNKEDCSGLGDIERENALLTYVNLHRSFGSIDYERLFGALDKASDDVRGKIILELKTKRALEVVVLGFEFLKPEEQKSFLSSDMLDARKLLGVFYNGDSSVDGVMYIINGLHLSNTEKKNIYSHLFGDLTSIDQIKLLNTFYKYTNSKKELEDYLSANISGVLGNLDLLGYLSSIGNGIYPDIDSLSAEDRDFLTLAQNFRASKNQRDLWTRIDHDGINRVECNEGEVVATKKADRFESRVLAKILDEMGLSTVERDKLINTLISSPISVSERCCGKLSEYSSAEFFDITLLSQDKGGILTNEQFNKMVDGLLVSRPDTVYEIYIEIGATAEEKKRLALALVEHNPKYLLSLHLKGGDVLELISFLPHQKRLDAIKEMEVEELVSILGQGQGVVFGQFDQSERGAVVDKLSKDKPEFIYVLYESVGVISSEEKKQLAESFLKVNPVYLFQKYVEGSDGMGIIYGLENLDEIIDKVAEFDPALVFIHRKFLNLDEKRRLELMRQMSPDKLVWVCVAEDGTEKDPLEQYERDEILLKLLDGYPEFVYNMYVQIGKITPEQSRGLAASFLLHKPEYLLRLFVSGQDTLDVFNNSFNRNELVDKFIAVYPSLVFEHRGKLNLSAEKRIALIAYMHPRDIANVILNVNDEGNKFASFEQYEKDAILSRFFNQAAGEFVNCRKEFGLGDLDGILKIRDLNIFGAYEEKISAEVRENMVIRTQQLLCAATFSDSIGDKNYEYFDQFEVDENESKNSVFFREFVEKYPIGNKGKTILVLCAAKAFEAGATAGEVVANIRHEVESYEKVIDRYASLDIPTGLRASMGTEYEITKPNSEGHRERFGMDLKSNIMSLSMLAEVGQGRDAVHEIATKPTDNPALLLAEMHLLQELGFIDLNFNEYTKGSRGYHLTIGGAHGLRNSRDTRFLLNTLVMSGWAGINAGKVIGAVSSGRNIPIRDRGFGGVQVFKGDTQSTELRSVSIDAWEPFERTILTSYFSSIAIQTMNKYCPVEDLKDFLDDPRLLSDWSDNFISNRSLSGSDLEESSKIVEIVGAWVKLMSDAKAAVDYHNENFPTEAYNEEVYRQMDEATMGENFEKKLDIDPAELFSDLTPEFINRLTMITNLFIKPSLKSGGDTVNAAAILSTTKIGKKNGEEYVEESRRTQYSSMFDRGESRQGYYYVQNGSQEMIIHKIQQLLLEFNQRMQKVLSRSNAAVIAKAA